MLEVLGSIYSEVVAPSAWPAVERLVPGFCKDGEQLILLRSTIQQ